MESVDPETRARVNAMWELMNRDVRTKSTPRMVSTSQKKKKKNRSSHASHGVMAYLDLSVKKPSRGTPDTDMFISGETKKLAAAALSNVKDTVLSSSGKGSEDDGREEVPEVGRVVGGGGVDAVLEQIRKKAKVSVMEKTKKDWGEFKEENKEVGEELDAYRRSSEKYLDRVSFLQRADYREFERERDARLLLQSRRSNHDNHP